MKNFLFNNRRGIFYGFFVAIGLVFLQEILRDADQRYFFISAGILYLIFVFEVLSSLVYAKKVLTQMEIPQVDTYSTASQITHHFILPTILYLSCLGIIYYYHLTLPQLLFFFISFFIYSLLFINLRAYYEDKFKLEEKTHYIYDVIKFITFFQLTNTIFEISQNNNIDKVFIYILVGISALFISTLVVIRRRQFTIESTLFNIVTSTIISAVTYLLFSRTSFSLLSISIYVLLVFYMTSAILHHKLEGTLNREILLEYAAVLLLSLVILQGISNY